MSGQQVVPIGSALARKLYSVALFATTQRTPSLRKNLTGPAPKQTSAELKLKGQTSPDYPIVRVTDLSKTAGDTVSVDMFDIIKGKPVMGDRKLAGKMMTMSYSSMDVRIDQCRAGVDPGGRMTQQRTMHNLRKLALANLSGYASRLEDQLCLVHLAGARGYDTGADWVIPLEADADFNDIVINTVRPPTANRRLFAGNATSVNNLATTDFLSLDDIDRVRVFLDEAVHPLQPIRMEGDHQAYENPLFCMYVTARQWHYLQNNTTDPAWRTFLANAHERSKGFMHPLFMGTVGMWNGILLKKMSRGIRFPTGTSVQEYDANGVAQAVPTAVETDRAIILGAQALADVYGRHQRSGYHYNWHEEETDHGNTVEVSIAMMGGKSKLHFEVDGEQTDHGVMTMDTYAPNPNP